VAREWLRQVEGTAAFEAARQRAGIASLDPADPAGEGEADGAADEADGGEDERIN
jgi:hypothetical protein